MKEVKIKTPNTAQNKNLKFSESPKTQKNPNPEDINCNGNEKSNQRGQRVGAVSRVSNATDIIREVC